MSEPYATTKCNVFPRTIPPKRIYFRPLLYHLSQDYNKTHPQNKGSSDHGSIAIQCTQTHVKSLPGETENVSGPSIDPRNTKSTRIMCAILPSLFVVRVLRLRWNKHGHYYASFDSLLSRAGFGHLGKWNWLTGLTDSSTRAGTGCTDLQRIDSSVVDFQAWPFFILLHNAVCWSEFIGVFEEFDKFWIDKNIARIPRTIRYFYYGRTQRDIIKQVGGNKSSKTLIAKGLWENKRDRTPAKNSWPVRNHS